MYIPASEIAYFHNISYSISENLSLEYYVRNLGMQKTLDNKYLDGLLLLLRILSVHWRATFLSYDATGAFQS